MLPLAKIKIAAPCCDFLSDQYATTLICVDIDEWEHPTVCLNHSRAHPRHVRMISPGGGC